MLVSLVGPFASIANNWNMNKEYLQKFANHLKKLRKELGYTQDDIASDDISRGMVSLVEIVKTDITLSKIKAIADSMNIPVRDLFQFEADSKQDV